MPCMMLYGDKATSAGRIRRGCRAFPERLKKERKTMTQAKQGDTVKVHYSGTLSDGTVFDSSEGRDPLQFTLGAGQIIPGFERAVEGLAPGEKTTTVIPPEHAYGEHQPEAVLEVPLARLPPDLNPEVGQQLQMQGENGQPIPVRVTGLSDDTVTIDANHPLAGKELTFQIELVTVD